MPKTIHTQKHLTLSDRIFIEQSLLQRKTFKEIGIILKKDPSTISKEIRKHRAFRQGAHSRLRNNCALLATCDRFRICEGQFCNMLCKRNRACTCTSRCPDFIPYLCPSLSKPPYACNGCPTGGCQKDKYYYRAKDANDNYTHLLHEARQGVNLSSEDRASLDSLVSPLLLKGQTMDHIFAEHGNELPCSRRTLYRYIDAGLLEIKTLDLPRKVKYKPRKSTDNTPQLQRAFLTGRTYPEFLSYLEKHPEYDVIELDTVVGPSSGKVVLTMLFRSCNLMLGFLMDNVKSESAIQVFRLLQQELGAERFSRMFPVLLSDRGSEFTNPEALECDENGVILSRLFYCNANAPYQKGKLEKNHEFLRYIIPKGTSFDNFTQADITLAINHINSTARGSLNGHNPYQLASLLLDEELFRALHLELVEPDRVLLKPALLKR